MFKFLAGALAGVLFTKSGPAMLTKSMPTSLRTKISSTIHNIADQIDGTDPQENTR